MLKLMKLEWKKNRIGKYVRNAVILTVVLLAFTMLIVGEGEFDLDESIEMYGANMINAFIDLLTHMSYIVFTGVMLSAFVVNDFSNKTINLLFSYPIKRQKIMLSKIFAVWIFNFAAMTLSKVFIYGILLLTKSYTHISTASIQMGELSFWLNIILSSVAMVSISYVALLVGLKMKSSKAVIVTSIIIACFTQGNIGEFTLVGSIPFYAVLFVLACISVFLSINNVEVNDVL